MKKTKKMASTRKASGESRCLYLDHLTLEMVDHPITREVGVSKVVRGCMALLRVIQQEMGSSFLEILPLVPASHRIAARRALQVLQALQSPPQKLTGTTIEHVQVDALLDPERPSGPPTGAPVPTFSQRRAAPTHDHTKDARLQAPTSEKVPENLSELLPPTSVDDLL